MTTIGMMRWDPLTSAGSQIGNWNRTWLGPNKYHYRAPFFLSLGSNVVTGGSDSQAVCDRQIRQARACGVDYFAYALQPDVQGDLSPSAGGELSPITSTPWDWIDANAALRLHRSSSIKSMVKWCIDSVNQIGEGVPVWNDPTSWPTVRDFYVTAMTDPDYMTVLGGRPLLFFYAADQLVTLFGDVTTTKANLDDLRARTVTATGQNPYLVTLWSGAASTHISDLGFDAAGRYTGLSASTGEAYSTFATRVEGTWATDIGSSTIIPFCSMGVDSRPISDNPITGSYAEEGEGTPGNWTVAPTNAQLVTHVKNAMSFVAAHPTQCPANTMCIYNWSEPTECSASMWPTWGDNGMRLQSMAQGLKRQHDNPHHFVNRMQLTSR